MLTPDLQAAFARYELVLIQWRKEEKEYKRKLLRKERKEKLGKIFSFNKNV